jgi:hypothetical protein
MGKANFLNLARCFTGIRRSLQALKPKAHLTLDNLVRFCTFVNLYSPCHLAQWSALCVGFFSFLQSGNLVPKLKGAWQPGTHLTHGDVCFVERGAILSLCHTKTRQFDGPPIEVPIPYIPSTPFCPVTALRCLFAVIPLPSSQPLFSFSSSKWITYSDLWVFIRALASKNGLDPSLYGCHSARSRGATFASESGAPDFHVKLQGQWKSDAYLRYLCVSLHQRWALPVLMSSSACSRVG